VLIEDDCDRGATSVEGVIEKSLHLDSGTGFVSNGLACFILYLIRVTAEFRVSLLMFR